MSETRPTGTQLRFQSEQTGEHVLDDYLENAEIGGRTLGDLLGDLFDAQTGNLAANLEFKVDNGNLEYRHGIYVDPNAGWQALHAYYTDRGAYTSGQTYNRLEIAKYGNGIILFTDNVASAPATPDPVNDSSMVWLLDPAPIDAALAQTAADVTTTNNNAAATAADVITTNNNVTTTNTDAATTTADRIATAADVLTISGWKTTIESQHGDVNTWHTTVNTKHADVNTWQAEVLANKNSVATDKAAFDTDYAQFNTDYSSFVTAKSDFDTKYADTLVKHADVVTKHSEANTSATNAANSATAASNSETTTLGYRNESETFRNEAQAAAASLTAAFYHAGPWDASTGAPPTPTGSGHPSYIISVAGTISTVDYAVGDNINWDGSGWYKIDNTETVYNHHTQSALNPTLTGANVPSTITVNTEGHVTGITTRVLTPANIGAAPAGDVLTPVPAGALFTDTVYSHPSHAGDDINIDTGALTGATVISDLDFNVTTDTQGHVTDANATIATRTLTLANLGYTGATNANNYVHPSYAGDDMSVDTGPLTGATVISDLDFNVTTDTSGHVTDANATVATRTLTLANLGYTGATNANNYVHPTYAGDDINIDTGPLSGATVISDLDFNVTTDTSGHVTDANATIATRNLTAANIGAAATSHNHSASNITSGTLATARGGTGRTDGLVNAVVDQNGGSMKFWEGTQAQYDALTPAADTTYIVVG